MSFRPWFILLVTAGAGYAIYTFQQHAPAIALTYFVFIVLELTFFRMADRLEALVKKEKQLEETYEPYIPEKFKNPEKKGKIFKNQPKVFKNDKPVDKSQPGLSKQLNKLEANLDKIDSDLDKIDQKIHELD